MSLTRARRRESERRLTEEEVTIWLGFGIWRCVALNFASQYLDHGSFLVVLSPAPWVALVVDVDDRLFLKTWLAE